MPNSIINSDDGVVSGTSGIKTTGGDTGGLEIQSNGVNVFDTFPTQVVARQTFYAIDAGVPITARSTDSNAYKIALEDTSGGTQRCFIGANSTNALMIANGSATNVMNVTSAGVLQANSGFGSVANAYMCRAWAAYTTSTIPATLQNSGNISSLTDNGVGDVTLTFTNAMPDTWFSTVAAAELSSSNSDCAVIRLGTTNTVRVITTANSAFVDVPYISVAVFR